MASSSSLLVRSIYRQAFSRSSNSRSCSWIKSASCWMSTAATPTETVISPSTVKKSSPWLMLPPEFEGGGGSTTMSYKFYSLADNEIVTLESSILIPKEDLRFKGSSHGWLALYNRRNLDLFLYNPLSRRHVMLPPAHTLPNIPKGISEGGYGSVTRVIISCSPDEPDCRAMVIYNIRESLAFCCPGSSNQWTDETKGKVSYYSDFVYSSKEKVFFCINTSGEFETWDLRDPSSPRMTRLEKNKVDKNLSQAEKEIRSVCDEREYLVLNSDHDLLIVTQYIMECVASDGSFVDFEDDPLKFRNDYPQKTVDFDIHKYDPDNGDFKIVDCSSLGGLAIFVGFYNHSVALSPVDFPELKSNSIYFTDPIEPIIFGHEPEDNIFKFQGHDIGIFDYQDKTISPCYYPCDIPSFKKIVPSPMWFFPSWV